MRTVVLIGLVAGFGVLLQTTVLHVLPFQQTAPDILLVLSVYLALHYHTVGGVVGAFLLGYLEDSVSGSATGLNAFAMVTVFLLVYLTCRRFWLDNIISRVAVVFLASLVKVAAVMALLTFFLSFDWPWPTVAWDVFLYAGLAAAVAPAVFAFLGSARLEEGREAR